MLPQCLTRFRAHLEKALEGGVPLQVINRSVAIFAEALCNKLQEIKEIAFAPSSNIRFLFNDRAPEQGGIRDRWEGIINRLETTDLKELHGYMANSPELRFTRPSDQVFRPASLIFSLSILLTAPLLLLCFHYCASFCYRKAVERPEHKRDKMPVAFITGATGFVGHHVAEALIRKGWSLRALCRRHSAQYRDLPGIAWQIGDIRNPDQVMSAMSGAEAVFHVAADYRLWARNPRDIYESNVTGTVNVMQAALAAGVRRVVHTSSVGALGLVSDGTPADENTPSVSKTWSDTIRDRSSWPNGRLRNSSIRDCLWCSSTQALR